ncbi:unnamed protein product, partial [marine sediment metagenome]
KLIVWHKTEKAKYKVLAIDWNSATIELIKLEGENPDAFELNNNNHNFYKLKFI